MKVRVGAATDIGQVRDGNEDSFLLQEPLYAVADGMGGHRGGEVASNLALETVKRLFSAQEGDLTEQVEQANRAVFERSKSDREVQGMGTTLTAALVLDDRVRLAHVGDSRAYLYRGDRLHLLTEDHTLVHRMVQEGELTEEEAETHPHRSILTRALGVDGAIQVDEGMVKLEDGDRLLLCTDGLTGMLTDEEIASVLGGTRDPQEAVERLVRAANRAGGIDNITAVILDFSSDGPGGVRAESREAVPHAPTEPHEIPKTTPPARDDITVVGRPIPGSPPKDRARTVGAARTRSRAIRTVGIGTGVTLAVLVIGAVGLRLYLDSQWFVGISNGRVAIFRGVPAEVVGFDLNSVVVETSIPAEDASSLAIYRDELPSGITAHDRAQADAIVDRIRRDVERAQPLGS
jgi:serine/threonine protein phosphatase PrpC